MGNFTIYKNEGLIASGQPVMHAIIIGVEVYPYAGHILDDLSSPSHSAREIAMWLLDCNLDDHQPYPLGSLSLLISEDTPEVFQHTAVVSVIPEQADSVNVQEAVSDWIQLANNNEQDLSLFYFCGHGVTNGLSSQSLLLSDYHKNPLNEMNGAINFKGFLRGMKRCAASHQLYFIDACRNTSEIATDTDAKGHTLIQPNTNRLYSSSVEAAVYYATVEGGQAYGKRNDVSYFTDALLQGLRGTGSHNSEADRRWRVSTGLLSRAIHFSLSFINSKHKLIGQSQSCEFDFHLLDAEPEALVLVSCNNGQDNFRATMECYSSGILTDHRLIPEPGWWQIHKNPGHYDFLAQVDVNTGRADSIYITPPYNKVDVRVLP